MDRKTVLLVEDDAEIRDALQDILEGEGYDVIPAGNGHQALEFLRVSRPVRPDVVILDIMMPIVDGRQVLEAMQAEQDLAQIPVIVVSAMTRDKPVGATAFMQKPIAIGALFEMVRAFTKDGLPPSSPH
jgi:two-component system, chemotaxis family, chemotaxis protein CheY